LFLRGITAADADGGGIQRRHQTQAASERGVFEEVADIRDLDEEFALLRGPEVIRLAVWGRHYLNRPRGPNPDDGLRAVR
jgi:hypothetical protein